MARGETFPLGAERVAQNGYHYIKTPTGWRLRHHLVAEEKLGRKIDTKRERVLFADRNCHNFDPDNIVVEEKRTTSKEARKASLLSRIEELQAQLDDLEEEEEAS